VLATPLVLLVHGMEVQLLAEAAEVMDKIIILQVQVVVLV
jgi:hypothetical protein